MVFLYVYLLCSICMRYNTSSRGDIMDVLAIFKTHNTITLQLNEELEIIGLSSNLSGFPLKSELLDSSLHIFLRRLFDSEFFANPTFIENILKIIANSIKKHTPYRNNFIVTNSLSNSNFYDFTLHLQFIDSNSLTILLTFENFRELSNRYIAYETIYQTYDNLFPSLMKFKKIGHFILDFTVSNEFLFADDTFAELLSIEPKTDSTYPLIEYDTLNNVKYLLRDESFCNRSKSLVNGQIETFIEEWKATDNWVKLEAKVLKRNDKNECQLIGGVLYDTTDAKNEIDASYLHSIYELAINVGGIGIFHYDLDKYSNKYFEANTIYENMLGLDANKDGYYLLSDFQKVLLPLEEDISNNEDVRKSLDKLLQGAIEGTTDDIIKIRNLKTSDIKYLLSSSRIDARYDNGDPRRFGGIVIDITERIQNEKNQIKFAYRDALTLLANNRKLAKDMKTRKDGIGLFFDLDNFKKVNDKYGHAMGDKILLTFGNSLTKIANNFSNVFVYRLYGDEFFVFCEGHDESIATEFSTLVHKDLKTNKEVSSLDIKIEASMGYSIYKASTNIDDFIKSADYAMYSNKIHKKTGR